jgi:hypothetical protein
VGRCLWVERSAQWGEARQMRDYDDATKGPWSPDEASLEDWGEASRLRLRGRLTRLGASATPYPRGYGEL